MFLNICKREDEDEDEYEDEDSLWDFRYKEEPHLLIAVRMGHIDYVSYFSDCLRYKDIDLHISIFFKETHTFIMQHLMEMKECVNIY